MKLTVFGATGATGQQVVRQALEAGDTVTAVARRPRAIGANGTALRVMRADLGDALALRSAIAGSDAVVSALGAPRGSEPTTVYSEGIRAILQAMQETDVRRVVTISAAPAGPDDQKSFVMRRLVEPVLYHFFGEAYADMRRMESVLATSDQDWTVVRPPRLTNGSASGEYRTAIDAPVARTRSISRADLAAAVLAAVPDVRLYRRALSVSY